MRTTLIFSLLVVGVAVALVISAYSALAGSEPVSSVAGMVVSVDGPDGGDEVQDVDGDEDFGQAKGARHIAEVMADEFGAGQEDVLALREEGIGFGALFKLYALAAAMDMSVDDLLATLPTDGEGGYEFGFGKLRKALSEDQMAVLEAGAKNLGQLVSASQRTEHTGPDLDGPTAAGLENAREKFAAHASSGHGPPESVPAHGRR